MSPLESVDSIFQFFGEGPQFAVVEENTCNICIDSFDFTVLLIFLLSKIVFSVLKASTLYCQNLSAVDVLFRV